jgi:hypothetical protein
MKMEQVSDNCYAVLHVLAHHLINKHMDDRQERLHEADPIGKRTSRYRSKTGDGE